MRPLGSVILPPFYPQTPQGGLKKFYMLIKFESEKGFFFVKHPLEERDPPKGGEQSFLSHELTPWKIIHE
jgi:hypothetical protein